MGSDAEHNDDDDDGGGEGGGGDDGDGNGDGDDAAAADTGLSVLGGSSPIVTRQHIAVKHHHGKRDAEEAKQKSE